MAVSARWADFGQKKGAVKGATAPKYHHKEDGGVKTLNQMALILAVSYILSSVLIGNFGVGIDGCFYWFFI